MFRDSPALVRKKVAQVLVVFSLVCAIGGNWAFLQSVAWLGMLMNYSHDTTLVEALQKTFDGRHPCKLCKVVQDGKKSESERALLKVETKLDLLLVRAASWLNPPPSLRVLPGSILVPQVRSESPPTPPPPLA